MPNNPMIGSSRAGTLALAVATLALTTLAACGPASPPAVSPSPAPHASSGAALDTGPSPLLGFDPPTSTPACVRRTTSTVSPTVPG
jgi:hypothetical protein